MKTYKEFKEAVNRDQQAKIAIEVECKARG